MSTPAKVKWWWNIPIILLIGILVPLGVRSVVTDDNRYGWGTFSKQIVYEVEYYIVYDDGEIEKYLPGNELKGIARVKLNKFGNTRYSAGAMKSWVNNYLEYLYENIHDRKIKTVRAEVLYTINQSRRIIPTVHNRKITLEYPPDTLGSN